MPTCRLLPHGNYSLIPAVLTSMAWLASLFQDGCDYARMTGTAVGEIVLAFENIAYAGGDIGMNATTNFTTVPPWLEVGIGAYRQPSLNTKTGHWQTVYVGNCNAYPFESGVVTQDLYWTAAKAFDFLALVLGGGGTFFLWFTGCCVFSPGTWRWTGYEVLAAAIFQALSFLWLDTSMCRTPGTNCALFWGSKADIVSTVLWTVAAMCILCHYPTPVDYRGGDGVWVEEGASAANVTGPTVEMSRASPGTGGVPTVTTAATAASSATLTETPAGQSSRQRRGEDSGSGRTAEDKDMNDIELL